MGVRGAGDPSLIVYYRGMAVICHVLAICSILLVLFVLIPFVVPFITDAQSFTYIRKALNLNKALNEFVKSVLPTKVAGTDITIWIVIVCAIVLNRVFTRLRWYSLDREERAKLKRDYEAIKKKMHLSDNTKLLAPLKEKIENFEIVNKKDRDELLRVFAETKKKLDSMGRDLAFLAIDVVNSTGMKQGEEKATIEHDFREFKRFVDGILKVNGTIKSAWTPDGVMSCFPNVDAAVKSARQVISGLEGFNKNVKAIKEDFLVRCGVNSGFVYFDETVPMEEMSDRVIDIAGHMQKHAFPNTICIAKQTVEPMEERVGFEPAGKVVDGYEVYFWKKE